MTYAAFGFHPSLMDGRVSGTLQVTGEGVWFRFDGRELLFPKFGLVVRAGGASDRITFVEHASLPEWSVYTSDPAFLADATLQSLPGMAGALGAIKRRRRGGWAILGGVALVLIALALGLFLAKPWMVGRIADQVPVEWEIELGDASYAAITANAKLLEDGELQQRLEAFAHELTAQIEGSRYPFRFHIVDEDSLNAYALPGGNVVIHSATLLEAGRGEEVLGVLAHELAHVNRRHSLHGIIDQVGFSILLGALFGNGSALGSVIHATAPTLNQRAFSRDNERDADLTGLTYLKQANIDPQGMVDFFLRIEKEGTANPLNGMLNFASTHPSTTERISTLEKAIAAEPKRTYRDVATRFDALKQRLQALLDAESQEVTP